MTLKLEHWKKLDHIIFLLMFFPLAGGLIHNYLSEDSINFGIFIIASCLWALVMIIDQLEEK